MTYKNPSNQYRPRILSISLSILNLRIESLKATSDAALETAKSAYTLDLLNAD